MLNISSRSEKPYVSGLSRWQCNLVGCWATGKWLMRCVLRVAGVRGHWAHHPGRAHSALQGVQAQHDRSRGARKGSVPAVPQRPLLPAVTAVREQQQRAQGWRWGRGGAQQHGGQAAACWQRGWEPQQQEWGERQRGDCRVLDGSHMEGVGQHRTSHVPDVASSSCLLAGWLCVHRHASRWR